MKHGIVTSSKMTKTGHLTVTVQSSRAGVTWKNVVVGQDGPGNVQNIQEGWHVALDKCEDGLWIVMKVLNTDPDMIPSDLNASERSLKLDDGTEISARKNDAGDYDVTISASGNVYLGAAEKAESASKNTHKHEVTLSDGSTATTSQPTDSGTETQVQ